MAFKVVRGLMRWASRPGLVGGYDDVPSSASTLIGTNDVCWMPFLLLHRPGSPYVPLATPFACRFEVIRSRKINVALTRVLGWSRTGSFDLRFWCFSQDDKGQFRLTGMSMPRGRCR